jgi:hypothetical protein
MLHERGNGTRYKLLEVPHNKYTCYLSSRVLVTFYILLNYSIKIMVNFVCLERCQLLTFIEDFIMATFVNDAIGGNSPFSSGGGIGAIPFGVPVGGGDGGFGGIGGGLLLGALLGGGGLFGRGHGHDHGGHCGPDNIDVNVHSTGPACPAPDYSPAFIAAILNNLNNISAAIPTSALETQGALNAAISSLALGTQQGLSNVKDSVQNAGTANLLATAGAERTTLLAQAATLAAVAESKFDIAVAIRDDGDKTRAQIALYHEADLQRQLAVAQNALTEERSHGRIREVEVNVSQTVNQQQVQAQAQAQQQQQANFLAGILAEVRNLAGDIQAVKQGQVIFNSGTMAASGTQAAANTKVA